MKEWLTVRNGIGVVVLWLFFRTAGEIRTQGVVHVDAAALSFGLLLAAVCIFSPAVSEYVSGPFTRIIDAIYYGNNDAQRPLLNLKRADYYRSNGCFDKAIREYRKQLRHHPRSPDVWAGLIDTAAESGNLKLAREFRRKAYRRLKGGDRIVLERGTIRR